MIYRFIPSQEKKIIDTAINEMFLMGYDVAGADMGKLFQRTGKFFRRIGKGVKSLAQKIRQRLRERNITADIKSDDSSFRLGPDSITARTPGADFSTSREGMSLKTPDIDIQAFQKTTKDIPGIEEPSQGISKNMLLIGGVGILALALVMSKK